MIKTAITHFFCLQCPGLHYFIKRRFLLALIVIIASLLLLAYFTISRSIITAQGFYYFNLSWFSIHIVSWLHAFFLSNETSKQSTTKFNQMACISLWFISCWAIAIFIHINKSWLLGYNLYHIPSKSMQPTLQIGDVVISDSWFKESDIKQGAIAIFKRHPNGIILIKRITQVRKNSNNTQEIFVEGDNKNFSVDSRRFGWVNANNIIGIASAKVFSLKSANPSIKNENRNLR